MKRRLDVERTQQFTGQRHKVIDGSRRYSKFPPL